jgi:hypothetical protein
LHFGLQDDWDFDKHYQWDGSFAQVGIVMIVPAEQFHQFHPQQLDIHYQ